MPYALAFMVPEVTRHVSKGVRPLAALSVREFAMELWLVVMSEAMPREFHEQDCQNMR